MILLDTRPLYASIVALSIAVLVADYFSGPFVQFPLFYLAPIALAAWYGRLSVAIGLALAMPLVRLYYSVALWNPPWSEVESATNAVIRVLTFGLFAVLIHRLAEQQRAMQRELKMLRGFLPICSFCKKIRTEDGAWQQLERYIHEHSEAEFTHTVCPTCQKEHYGALLNEQHPG